MVPASSRAAQSLFRFCWLRGERGQLGRHPAVFMSRSYGADDPALQQGISFYLSSPAYILV